MPFKHNTPNNFRLKTTILLVLALCGILFLQQSAHSLEIPERPTGRVTDLAGLLTPNQIADLNRMLAEFEAKTTNEIAVLIIKSLEGENLEDYSIRVVEKWKLGQADKDNGVLLLIAVRDR
ncbi:MAG TPA: hypothetical protein ENI41_00140, partial [Deltaproteobacteria bacterium]|nr:hypothetical protein [Deltaproteobacteria bacterium]